MQTSPGSLPVVLITGASLGIGRETAALLARSGFRVFGTSRHPEHTPPIAGVIFLPLDVHSPASIAACVESVLAQAGRIDVLVNNAGMIGPGSASEEIDIQQVRLLFETNFFGVVQMTNAVLPGMRARRAGKIINISSAAGRAALPPFFTFYAASKHALEAYAEGLYYETAPLGIQVALVEPGYTDTGILETVQPPDHPIEDYAAPRAAMTLLNRAGIRYGSRPEATAQTVLRVLHMQRPALRHPVGFDSLAIGLLRRFLPAPFFEALARWMFLTWSPRGGASADVPAPRELGLHRILFHGPTLRITYRLGFTTLGLAVLAGLLRLFRRLRR